MKGEKRSIKRSINKSLYFSVFNLLKEGKRPSEISKVLNLKPSHLEYYTTLLKKKGIIERKAYGVWEVKRSINFLNGSERSINKPITDLHAFNIKFPILSGEIKDTDWEIKNKLNNWLPKYKKLDIFEGLTIRNNNNKSVSIFLKPRNIDFLQDPFSVEKLAFKLKTYLYEYFKLKHGVVLDVFSAETKNIHLETQDNEKLEGFLKKGEVYEVGLNKKAEKIFPKDDIDAKAWFDNSPNPNMIATNDLAYKRELIFMPFRIKNLSQSMPALEEYNRNLKLHTKVQEAQLKTQKEIQELLKELKDRNI